MEAGNHRGFGLEMHAPGIAVITFDQPQRLNGMTQGMKRDLIETLLQAQMDESVRVVVFTGSGRAFSAGDDISGHAPGGGGTALVPPIGAGHTNAIGTYAGLRALSQPLNLAIRNLDTLSIAAINGVAIQTGFSLALSCDFRIASADARMGSATLRFGLLPDEGGQFLLTQLLGVAKTMEFLMLNRIVTANEAHDLGLVHEVVPAEQLMERTMDLARQLADGPQVAMRLLKRSVYNAGEMTFAHALDDIASKTAISDHHPDAIEGMRAFQQKRTPQFNQWLTREEKA